MSEKITVRQTDWINLLIDGDRCITLDDDWMSKYKAQGWVVSKGERDKDITIYTLEKGEDK